MTLEIGKVEESCDYIGFNVRKVGRRVYLQVVYTGSSRPTRLEKFVQTLNNVFKMDCKLEVQSNNPFRASVKCTDLTISIECGTGADGCDVRIESSRFGRVECSEKCVADSWEAALLACFVYNFAVVPSRGFKNMLVVEGLNGE